MANLRETDSRQSHFVKQGQQVLQFLRKRLGFSLWMITRAEGENWIVLQAEDHGYGVSSGQAFNWCDSFCSEMVKGNGPRIAPDSSCVPAYAAALIGTVVPIRAYIGLPLYNADGCLFGTLCAIDPEPQPEMITQEEELIEMLGILLNTILLAELETEAAKRLSERLELEAQTDAMTNLPNRRAWNEVMAREEERCKRYGHPAAIISIDLDGLKRVNDIHGHAAGDALIQEAAKILHEAAREVDLVARLGGDEFGVLAVECNEEGANALATRIQECLESSGVSASIGYAMRRPTSTLTDTLELADKRMYELKKLFHLRHTKG